MLYLLGGHLTGAGVTQSDTQVGQSWSFGSLVLCARQGSVVVQHVRLVHERGPMRLVAFALRPNPDGRGQSLVGNQPGDVSAATGGAARPGPARVHPCSAGSSDPERSGSELVVQLERTGPGDGCASALDVDYTVVPRGAGTIRLNFALGLNEPGSAAAPCE
jgi:hypothetical protein